MRLVTSKARAIRRLVLLIGILATCTGQAETFVLPPPDIDVVGEIRVTYATHEDTLLDIGRRYDIGYDELIHANPTLDRWIPGEGTPVVLPTRYVLPNAPRHGIVLNVPEMRLYYYPKPKAGQKPVVITHPVSIGRMDWKTPLGKTSVIGKQKDPAWYPPKSIKAEHAKDGDILPDVVPGGPDNPLGRHALRLGKAGYLIHGTNKPDGVGMRVTHGCVRMFPEDIERLFPMVSVGTPVYIVDQPMKVGHLAGALFLEFHPPLEESQAEADASTTLAIQEVAQKLAPQIVAIDPLAVRLVVEQASGLPVEVTAN